MVMAERPTLSFSSQDEPFSFDPSFISMPSLQLCIKNTMRSPRGVQSRLLSASLMVVKFLRDFWISHNQPWLLERETSESLTLILAPLIDLTVSISQLRKFRRERLILQVARMQAGRDSKVSIAPSMAKPKESRTRPNYVQVLNPLLMVLVAMIEVCLAFCIISKSEFFF